MNRKVGVFFSFLLAFLEILSSFLFIPFLIHVVGDSTYGVYSLVLTITSYLTILDLGLGNALLKYLSKYFIDNDRERLNSFCGFSLLFYLFISIFILSISILIIFVFPSTFSKGLNQQEIQLAQQLLIFSSFNIVATFIFLPFDKIILASKRYALQKIILIIRLLLRISLSVVALLLNFGIISIVIINLIMTILTGLFSAFYDFVYLKIRPTLKGFDKSSFKEMISYTGIIFISMIATQLNNAVDQVLIGAFVKSSTIILAVYSIGSQIYHYYQNFSNCINGILMPGVVALVSKSNSPEAYQYEMVKIGRIVFAFLALIFVVFVIEGKTFIALWVGEDKIDAYYVAVLLIGSITLCLTQSVGIQILWALNKHKEHAIIKLGIVILNIFLTYFLITSMSPLIGASLGTAISIFIGDVILTNIIFVKKLKINLVKYYRDLFKGILPCLLFILPLGLGLREHFKTGINQFVIVCFAMTVVYLILMYFFGLNNYEKNKILLIKRKLIKKR